MAECTKKLVFVEASYLIKNKTHFNILRITLKFSDYEMFGGQLSVTFKVFL
jgi:hypothetical protein